MATNPPTCAILLNPINNTLPHQVTDSHQTNSEMKKQPLIEQLYNDLSSLQWKATDIIKETSIENTQGNLQEILNQKIEQSVDLLITRKTENGDIKCIIQWDMDPKKESELWLKELLHLKDVAEVDLMIGVSPVSMTAENKKIARNYGVVFQKPDQISTEYVNEWINASFVHVYAIRKGVKSLSYSTTQDDDFIKANSGDEFLVSDGTEKLSTDDLIQELATDDLFTHLSDKLTGHETSYKCPVVLDLQDVSIAGDSPKAVQQAKIEIVAVRTITKYPLSCLIVLKEGSNQNLISDLSMDESMVETVESKETPDTPNWQLDLQRFREQGEIIDNITLLKGDANSPERSYSIKI